MLKIQLRREVTGLEKIFRIVWVGTIHKWDLCTLKEKVIIKKRS
jgi:hypothetical protein